ncbi:TPA: GTP pyrophosphokinase, partial [Streptococcus pneumoniae]|nr:GTP pyrophosphokinase [Streptococcus pneumoniae]
MIDIALAIAKKAHAGQVDKAGVDYIQHPLYVASQVNTEQEKAVALLHDVIEDSDITAADLFAS